jgi:RNA polymerase sigma factor (sigma-70 family)
MSNKEFNNELLSLKQPLEYFALSLTRDNDDAQDLVQDTFVKAITYKEKFEEQTNLKAWLYTIMKNTFINNYRRAAKANTIIDSTDDLYFLNLSKKSEADSPEAIYGEKEINKKVNALEAEYRVPFMMHFKGFKYKEIADELNLPIGTVKSRIFLARKKLMDVLKDYK